MSSPGTVNVSLYLKIIIAILGLAYLVSPMDIIPEILIPYLGWIDDGLVLGTIFYMLRYNRFPDLTFFRNRMSGRPYSQNDYRQRSDRGNSGQTDTGSAGYKQGSDKGSAGTDRSGHQHYRENNETDSGQIKNPYDVLGVPQNATRSQIQAAYKDAIKKYHPDKLSHLGEEFAHLANKKFLEIQNAYDELMKLNP